jgi:hypothetical protein
LVIPFGIHLLSRKEGKVILVGSIRHLQESETAQFSSIRLNEILLLILRCLIIILISIFMAGINVNLFSPERSKWLVVGAEIEKQIPLGTLDSLIKQGYEKHYLSDNFPISNKGPRQKQKSYWYLAEQLRQKNIDAVVFSTNKLGDFFGERISKPENVRWITVEQKDTLNVIGGLDLNKDSVWIRNALTTADLTQLMDKKILKIALDGEDERGLISKNDLITAAIYFTPEFANDAKIIQASLLTIKSLIPIKLKIEQNPTESKNADWTFWLSNEKNSVLDENAFALVDLKDRNIPLLISNDQSIYKTGVNASWLFTKRLTQGDAIQEKLPMQLASILLPKFGNEKYSTALPEEFTWSPMDQHLASMNVEESQTLNLILFFLISTFALLERWIAFRRKI